MFEPQPDNNVYVMPPYLTEAKAIPEAPQEADFSMGYVANAETVQRHTEEAVNFAVPSAETPEPVYEPTQVEEYIATVAPTRAPRVVEAGAPVVLSVGEGADGRTTVTGRPLVEDHDYESHMARERSAELQRADRILHNIITMRTTALDPLAETDAEQHPDVASLQHRNTVLTESRAA